MLRKVSVVVTLLTFLLPFVTAHWSKHHQEVARRARGDVDIHKRQYFSNSRFTFYDVGLGACGQYNVASDFIVALNVPQYGSGYPGPNCFLPITIQYGGKTAQATIMDECEACPYGGLDFSRGLFDYFADESLGVIYGAWWFDNGGGDTTSSAWVPPTTTWDTPTTSSTPDYTPPAPTTSSTPDYTPPPTTSSTPAYTPPPTTSTTTSTTTTTSSTTSSTSSTTVHSSATWSSWLPAPTAGQNILRLNSIVIDFAVLISAAQKNE